ncbi:MAG: hypothetical protein GY822_04220 [Deltaproteobacteria bacterium]|nr:hypothetical protein [Deltaproteobacteria bacterium]
MTSSSRNLLFAIGLMTTWATCFGTMTDAHAQIAPGLPKTAAHPSFEKNRPSTEEMLKHARRQRASGAMEQL